MHAVIGRVKIKPDRADEALSMIAERGVAMLQRMAGSTGGYWARTLDEGDIVQHSFWLFDTEENARAAEAEDFFDLGDQVLVFSRVRGRGKESGADVDSRVASLYSFRNGRVVRVEYFGNRDEALQAAGIAR